MNCETCFYNGPSCNKDCIAGHLPYQVVVLGTALYATDDELIADAVANNYKTIGWQNVAVKEKE